MSATPVTLSIGGQSYRVQSDAEPDTLQRLANLVDARVHACNPTGRLSPTQALLYAALTLADDLHSERKLRRTQQTHTQHSLQQLVTRIDAALEATNSLLPPAANP